MQPPRSSATTAAAPRWLCTYRNDAGGQARAVFQSLQAATSFAERHAFAIADAAAKPLVWKPADTGDSTTLTTQVGTYVVRLWPVDSPGSAARTKGVHRSFGWLGTVF